LLLLSRELRTLAVEADACTTLPRGLSPASTTHGWSRSRWRSPCAPRSSRSTWPAARPRRWAGRGCPGWSAAQARWGSASGPCTTSECWLSSCRSRCSTTCRPFCFPSSPRSSRPESRCSWSAAGTSTCWAPWPAA